MTQTYRNARTGYLTDILTDTTPIGAIVPNLKAGANSYDHSFIKAGAAAFPALSENTGTHVPVEKVFVMERSGKNYYGLMNDKIEKNTRIAKRLG